MRLAFNQRSVNLAIPDEAIVDDVLHRHGRDRLCRTAVENAWKVVKDYPDFAWFRRKGTLRALMWEHSVNNALAALCDGPGVHVSLMNDTVSFIFDDLVLLRFKKASQQLLSSNYPTQTSLLFHMPQADLFGYEGCHRVEVVHVFDQLESRLSFVGVVGRRGQQILWHFELPSDDAVVVPLQVTPELSPAAERVLRPKTKQLDKAESQ